MITKSTPREIEVTVPDLTLETLFKPLSADDVYPLVQEDISDLLDEYPALLELIAKEVNQELDKQREQFQVSLALKWENCKSNPGQLAPVLQTWLPPPTDLQSYERNLITANILARFLTDVNFLAGLFSSR